MFAAGDVITKFIYLTGVPPLFVFKLRLVVATLVLLVGCLIFAPAKLKIAKRDILRYAILSLVGFSGFIGCAMVAVSMINVGLAVFLQYLAPALIVLYYWLLHKQRPANYVLIAIAMTIIGGLLMLFVQNSTIKINLLGVALGLASAILYGFNTVYGKKLSYSYAPITTLFYSVAFAAVVWVFLPVGKVSWDVIMLPPIWMYLYVIICYTILPYGLFYLAVHFLPPANVTVTASLEPVLASVIAFVFLHELMTLPQIIGGALVLGAVILLQYGAVKRK